MQPTAPATALCVVIVACALSATALDRRSSPAGAADGADAAAAAAASVAASAHPPPFRRLRLPPRLRWGAALATCALFLFASALPRLLSETYADRGPGDQGPVALIVGVSLITPVIFWPFFQAKRLVVDAMMPAFVETEATRRGARWLLTPGFPFASRSTPPTPAPPRYEEDASWSALGRAGDSATSFPANSMPPLAAEALEGAAAASAAGGGRLRPLLPADTFYLHPTTFYSSSAWNSDAFDPTTSYLSDDAIIPQQASAFNVATRVFGESLSLEIAPSRARARTKG